MNSTIIPLPNGKVAIVVEGGRGYSIHDDLQSGDVATLKFLRTAAPTHVPWGDTTEVDIVSTNAYGCACRYRDHTARRDASEIKPLTLELFKKSIARLGCTGRIKFSFIGTEPLINAKLVSEVVDYARSEFPGSTFKIVTNSELLCKPMLDTSKTALEWLDDQGFVLELLNPCPWHAENFHTTPVDIQPYYERTLDTFDHKNLLKLRIVAGMVHRISIPINTTRYMQDMLDASNLVATGIGSGFYTELCVPPPIPVVEAFDMVNILEQQYMEVATWFICEFRKGNKPLWCDIIDAVVLPMQQKETRHISCRSGNGSMTIASDGAIYASYDSEFGGVDTDGKFDMARVREWRNNSCYRTTRCVQCAALQICGGGSRPLSSHFNNGNVSTINAVECLYQQMKLKIGLYLISELGPAELVRIYS